MTVDGYRLTGNPWIRRLSPQRSVAELMGKRWVDAVAPVTLLVVVLAYFSIAVPGFLSGDNLAAMTQILAEYGLLALAMTIVLVGGGLDLSVGSVYAVANACAVILFKYYGWPFSGTLLAALLVGVACGCMNGTFISVLKTRPFVTTLVTLLLFRGVAIALDEKYSAKMSLSLRTDASWDFFTSGRIAGLPVALWVLAAVGLAVQVILTRTRFGWRLAAMGAARPAARRAGIRLDRLSFQSYVASGALAGLAGFLVATRVTSASQTTGQGYEFVALTAVILGGVSLTGGRGTATRALIGSTVVVVLYQGLLLQNRSPDLYSILLAGGLVLFAVFDLKYAKNRDKTIHRLFIVPAKLTLGPLEDVTRPGSVWHPNRRLTGAEAIGAGLVEGPEDVVLDSRGNLYCGDRRGWVWKFTGPDMKNGSVLSRVGGLTLGLAVDSDDNIVVCAAGMGLYRISPEGVSVPLATHVKRSWFRLRDESAIRLTDDLDIAPDGKIYFSDASTRFDGTEYLFELMEARPNGRVLCFDPASGKTTTVVKNMLFPNGICVSHEGDSILIALTALCAIHRYWLAGPKQGTLEPFIENMPGMPDNINRASDGNYWVAFACMRSPSFDLAFQEPGFRRRMLKQLPQDDWLMANMNTACVVKVSPSGEVLESMWDETAEDHAVITSMREYDGWLYLGGLTNDRVGRVRVDDPPSEASGQSDELSKAERLRAGAAL